MLYTTLAQACSVKQLSIENTNTHSSHKTNNETPPCPTLPKNPIRTAQAQASREKLLDSSYDSTPPHSSDERNTTHRHKQATMTTKTPECVRGCERRRRFLSFFLSFPFFFFFYSFLFFHGKKAQSEGKNMSQAIEKKRSSSFEPLRCGKKGVREELQPYAGRCYERPFVGLGEREEKRC